MLQALATFAQSYTTLSDPNYDTYTSSYDVSSDASGTLMVIYLVALLVFGIPMVIGMWKLFQKAHKPGWAAIVPIYSTIVNLQIVGRPSWWIVWYVLACVPFLGIIPALVVGIIVTNDLAKSFGRGTGWTVFLLLLPFIAYPVLGFGKQYKYVGPAALPGGAGPAPAGPVAPPAAPAV